MIGLVVVLLDCLFPGRMREAFSVGVDNEDDECHTGEGYLNSGFLEGVIHDDVTQTGNSALPQQITTLTVCFILIIYSFTFHRSFFTWNTKDGDVLKNLHAALFHTMNA